MDSLTNKKFKGSGTHGNAVYSFVRTGVFALLLILSVFSAHGEEKRTLLVGIYQSHPLASLDEQGNIRGIYPDLLDAIAAENNWKIQYIPGPWYICLERLETGKIDLLVGIAWSQEREKVFDFTQETILMDWGQIFVPRNSPIQALPDLEGRSVAVLRGDFLFSEFEAMAHSFGIGCRFVEVEEYEQIFQLLQRQAVDAGLIDRLYGLQFGNLYNVSSTAIVCSPAQLRFAVPAGRHKDIIMELDQSLRRFKKEQNSVYHQSLNRWMHGAQDGGDFIKWLLRILILAGFALVLFIAISIFLRRQVSQKTSELRRQYTELEKEISERHQAENALRIREDLYRRSIAVADAVAYQRDFVSDTYYFMGEGIYFLAGYNPDEFTTQVWRSIIREAILYGECEGLTLDAAFDKFKNGDIGEWRADYRIATASGEERWLADSAIRLMDTSGRTTGCLGILQDITARKRVEEEREALQRLSHGLSGCRDIREVGKAVAGEARRLFHYDAFSLFDIDLEKNVSWNVYNEDTPEGESEPRFYPGDRTTSVPLNAASLRLARLINRASTVTDNGLMPFGETARISRSLMFAPIFLQERFVGRITVQSYSAGRYSERDLRLLQAIANQCGAALARTQAEETLRQREETYKRAITAADAVPYQRNYSSDHYIFVDDAIVHLTGYTREEFTVSLWEGLIRECVMRGEGAGCSMEEARQRVASGCLHEWLADYCIITKSGEERWLADSAIQICDEQGIPTGSFGILQDVTDRKRGEKERAALLEISRKLSGCRNSAEVGRTIAMESRAIFKHDAFALFSFDVTSGGANLVYQEDTPLDAPEPREIQVKNPRINIDDITRMAQPLLVNRRDPPRKTLFKAFGEDRLSRSLMFAPIRYGGELIGRITVQSYTLGKYTDNDLNLLNVIADQCSAAIARTQAEEALHEREELYRRAIAVADAVPYQRDYAEDVFLYMGEGITNLTGYPPQDFTTKVMKNIVQECILMGECEGMTLLEARNFCRSGSVREWRAQYRIRTAQGEERWIEDSSIQLFDPAGTVTGSLGLLRNITEQKRMEKERQVLQRLSQSLTGCRSAREVGQQVAVAAKTLFQYDAISLFNIFLDDSTIDAVYSEDILSDLEEPIEIPLSGSTIKLTKSAGELSRPSLVNRHDSDPIDPGFQVFGNTARRSRSLMFVPILLGDNLVGRLTVQSYTHGKYRESDLRLLQALAEHCGAALARTRVEAELHDREERYRLIVETAEEGVWVTDARGHTIFVNTKLSQMLGFSREEMMGLSVPSFMDHAVHPAATTSLENRRMAVREQHDVKFRRKDGSPLWTILTTSPILDSRGHFLGSLAMVTDITDRKHAEEQLLHDAFHDVLTGLPNRALFLDRLGVCLEHIKRRKDYFFAVLFLDLDRFKNINDSLGHFVGDQLLREVARRIEKSLRPGDTIARLGGDEFCLLLDDLAQVSDAILVAERIQNDLTVPVVLGNHEIFTSASIGIAISSSHYEKPEELLRDADTAMYRAKAQGRMRHEIFDPAMHQTAVELLQLESDLRRAVERHEFEYYYQPIVSIGNGMIVGLEALLRWNHPTRGHLAPADFLHIAEETGLIMPICWQLLGNACLQVRRWQMLSPDLAHLTLSVNLSSKQFSQPDLYDSMRQILKDTDLPPRSLILEITESIIMKHAESTISLLDRLKDLNLQIHIDDFGTGYSSLSYLHRFPVDAFKIDASFVMNMDIDQVNAEIVRTIIDLAKGLSLSVTAEGVEKEEQIKRLHQLGCGLGQGNYFSPPLSAFDVEKLLREVL